MIVDSEQSRQIMLRYAGAVSITKRLRVIFTDAVEPRSQKQNRLYASWVGIIADELGYTNFEMRLTFKEQHILPIMLQHPESYPQAEIAQEIRRMFPDRPEFIDRQISSKDMKVPHFALFLNQVEIYAGNAGIRLPHPEDQYYEALGRMAV